MLAAHIQNRAYGPARCLVRSFPAAPAQSSPVVQLRDWRDELRAVKTRVAEAYGYRMGGAPLKQIASDMEVTTARAGELLDVTHPRKLSAKYLARIARNNPVVASKLGVAGERVAA